LRLKDEGTSQSGSLFVNRSLYLTDYLALGSADRDSHMVEGEGPANIQVIGKTPRGGINDE
jgi:hypothetical protein